MTRPPAEGTRVKRVLDYAIAHEGEVLNGTAVAAGLEGTDHISAGKNLHYLWSIGLLTRHGTGSYSYPGDGIGQRAPVNGKPSRTGKLRPIKIGTLLEVIGATSQGHTVVRSDMGILYILKEVQ